MDEFIAAGLAIRHWGCVQPVAKRLNACDDRENRQHRDFLFKL
jgi:hypothetical protein